MWIMTRIGFFSVVQKTGDTKLTIRARERKDLEALLEIISGKHNITKTEHADYRWRITATHEQWAMALSRLALGIDYSNFKAEIASKDHERAGIYAKVWWHLIKIQEMEEAGARRTKPEHQRHHGAN